MQKWVGYCVLSRILWIHCNGSRYTESDGSYIFKDCHKGLLDYEYWEPYEGVLWRGLLKGSYEGVYWRGLLKGSIEGVYWRGLLKGSYEGVLWRGLTKGSYEGVYWRGLMKGSYEGVYWRGLLKGSIEGVLWRGLMKGSYEGVLRRGLLKGSYEGVYLLFSDFWYIIYILQYIVIWYLCWNEYHNEFLVFLWKGSLIFMNIENLMEGSIEGLYVY